MIFHSMEEVAEMFHISRRTLQNLIKTRPFYRMAGRRKIFSESDLLKLYESLPNAESTPLDRQ